MELRTVTRADYEAVTGLFNQALGREYITENELQQLTENGYCCVADDDGIVGASLCRVVNNLSEAFPNAQHKLAVKLQQQLDLKAPIGVMKTSVVLPEYRRRGLGSQMTVKRLEWLKERGADCAISTAWVNAGTAFAATPLLSSGFELVATLPEFWTQASLQEKYSCPTCGHPCYCSAQFFLYRF